MIIIQICLLCSFIHDFIKEFTKEFQLKIL